MLLHVDAVSFSVKPKGGEIGGIKARFADSASIKDMTVKQIADALTEGKTVQPGVCPFSKNSRMAGKKGTCKEDFTRQTIFMIDIDNENEAAPQETPEHIAKMLAAHDLKAAFMYESFNSSASQKRFRIAVVCKEEITDANERAKIQSALIAISPQSDISCINADRIFFGTDKGLIDDFTDFEAVCDKAALLTLADNMTIPNTPKEAAQPAQAAQTGRKNDWTKYGETIPTGQRHGTLVSFASTVLTKYGVCEKAYEAFTQRVAQCDNPLPDSEIARIWQDACNHYQSKIATNQEYLPPAKYEASQIYETLEPSDYSDVGQAKVFAAVFRDQIKYTPATRYIVYNGSVWEESETKAQGLSQELTERQLDEARVRVRKAQTALNEAIESGDDSVTKEARKQLKHEEAFRGYVLGERKSNKVRATLIEARPKIEIDVAQLDADGYLLNTPCGTVDLRTGQIKPHSPDDYCTKITTVAPDTANAEMFTEFMERVTVGDRELERYLQEVAGMCAVGRVLRENLIIAYGEGGNGKSTLFNLLAHVLGDYAGAL